MQESLFGIIYLDTLPFRMFRLQSSTYGQRSLREAQSNPGFMPTWIPGSAQILASNRAINEHETSTYGLQLPTNLQDTMANLTDGGGNQEVIKDGCGTLSNISIEAEREFPDQNLRSPTRLQTNLGTLQDGEHMETFCNAPNLLQFNGLTTSGVCVPVIMDPCADAPLPGDFESRSNWNFAMFDPGFLSASSTYRNRASAPIAELPMRLSVGSYYGCFASP